MRTSFWKRKNNLKDFRKLAVEISKEQLGVKQPRDSKGRWVKR